MVVRADLVVAGGGGAALGAQAGEKKLREVIGPGGFRSIKTRDRNAVQHGPGGSAIAMPTTRAWRGLRERLSNHGRRPLRLHFWGMGET